MRNLQKFLDSLVASGSAGALLHYQDADGPWVGASGVAEIGTAIPVDPAGSFRIGSVTKTFTATVVLQLVGEGVLALDDSVDRWLPGVVPAGKAITLRQLLNHTSGLYDYTKDLPDTAGVIRDRFVHWDPRATVDSAAVQPLSFEPGATYSYSNTNYLVLGLIIEAATSKSFETEIESRILHPLDLQQTGAPGDVATLPEPHARGYLTVDDQLVDISDFNASQAWAAGEFVSTASDLNRFYAALLTGKLLRPAELEAMQTTILTDDAWHGSGLGLSRIALPNLTLWGHSGGIFGYRTWSYHSADAIHQLTLSVTTTTDDTPPPPAYDLLADAFN
ncbi:serine hydrolase domain-containing protein [Kribbella albertanoniae]|uniref:Class A beta-lactamase-related serine hydrolase n=1 Tax=Kribbella albertanoniae TaxID=1266829 RepID=A0A4R4NZU6_9ACTN|nr:serine hydrolase domain-containing protein [Kribbella albertanoniae]TDC14724.1 class A beta-lactamase-related serine hydrolase [Kribbella albertanoniae]